MTLEHRPSVPELLRDSVALSHFEEHHPHRAAMLAQWKRADGWHTIAEQSDEAGLTEMRDDAISSCRSAMNQAAQILRWLQSDAKDALDETTRKDNARHGLTVRRSESGAGEVREGTE